MRNSANESKRLHVFSYTVTFGDILQVVFAIPTIIVSILMAANQLENSLNRQTEQIDAQLRRIFPDPNTVGGRLGEMYFFDHNLSSFKIVAIDSRMPEVGIQFNIRGTTRNEVLVANRTMTVPIPDGTEYSFILKCVDVLQGYENARFVVTPVSAGVKQ
ncbi:MAG: hypothetical protein NTZ17_03265 [Phycisphaerae bacterium]|nr:hypothetical protein [Phycisphaerae bacterium]